MTAPTFDDNTTSLIVREIINRSLAYLKRPSPASMAEWISRQAEAWEIARQGIHRPPYQGPRGNHKGSTVSQK